MQCYVSIQTSSKIQIIVLSISSGSLQGCLLETESFRATAKLGEQYHCTSGWLESFKIFLLISDVNKCENKMWSIRAPNFFSLSLHHKHSFFSFPLSHYVISCISCLYYRGNRKHQNKQPPPTPPIQHLLINKSGRIICGN